MGGGLVGGLYGVIVLIGRAIFTILVGPKASARIPPEINALLAGTISGGIIGGFFLRFLKTWMTVSPNTPAWVVGAVTGIFCGLIASVVLALIDEYSSKS